MISALLLLAANFLAQGWIANLLTFGIVCIFCKYTSAEVGHWAWKLVYVAIAVGWQFGGSTWVPLGHLVNSLIFVLAFFFLVVFEVAQWCGLSCGSCLSGTAQFFASVALYPLQEYDQKNTSRIVPTDRNNGAYEQVPLKKKQAFTLV